jgi:hypothetical protein
MHCRPSCNTSQASSPGHHIGTWLIERGGRPLQLTPAGSAFLDEASLALAQAERATEHAKQATRPNTGRLTLGFLLESEIDGGRCVALFGIIEMPAWEGGLEVLGRPLTWHIRSSDPSNDRWTADVA